jgi:two-component system, NarL family, response regulator LiaR
LATYPKRNNFFIFDSAIQQTEIFMVPDFLVRNKSAILYGLSLALLLFLLRWLELRLVIVNHAFEIYIGAIALIFTGLGIWLALKLTGPKVETVVVEKEVYVDTRTFTLNEEELNKLGISRRELEVLQLMSEGLSNQEIAQRLYVSLSTVKTHAKNLFEKLNVERRTQAIDRAKKMSLIP